MKNIILLTLCIKTYLLPTLIYIYVCVCVCVSKGLANFALYRQSLDICYMLELNS